jgi:hypothetical protein
MRNNRALGMPLLVVVGLLVGVGVAVAAGNSSESAQDTPPSPISVKDFCGNETSELLSTDFFGDNTFKSPQDAAAAAISTTGAEVSPAAVKDSMTVATSADGSLDVAVPASVASGTDLTKYGDFHVIVCSLSNGTYATDRLLQCQ